MAELNIFLPGNFYVALSTSRFPIDKIRKRISSQGYSLCFIIGFLEFEDFIGFYFVCNACVRVYVLRLSSKTIFQVDKLSDRDK